MLAQPDGKGSKPVGLLEDPDTELEKHHRKLMKASPQPAARYGYVYNTELRIRILLGPGIFCELDPD